MYNFIEHITISNFKSIRDCEITGCKKINLFIGRPNVGKSNILEALSLFSLPFLRESNLKKLSSLVRIENETELFYNGDIKEPANIETNIASCELSYSPKSGLDIDLHFEEIKRTIRYEKEEHVIAGEVIDGAVDSNLNIRGFESKSDVGLPIKRYQYKQDITYKKGHAKYLIPPFGNNLLSVIEQYTDLRTEVIQFFNDYNLEVAFDIASQTIKVLRRNDRGIFLIPYNSIADTLQRIIFYKAAITSNTNSILLFEEPEAHSFPPYMSHLTQEMIYKKDNQYFVATHSPFILNDLLENGMNELSVFIVYYEDGETRVRQLSESELHRALQNGTDLFTNSESFV